MSTKPEKPSQTNKHYIAASFRRISRSAWFRTIKSVLFFGFVGMVLYIFSQMNLFFVQDIVVSPLNEESLSYVSEEEIEKQLAYYIGKRIFSVRTDLITRDLEAAYPFIDHVYVTKRMPDTILVRIVEAEPEIIVRYAPLSLLFDMSVSARQESGYIVDSSGTVVGMCSENERLCTKLSLCSIPDTGFEVYQNQPIIVPELDQVNEIDGQLRERKEKVVGYALPEQEVIVAIFSDSTRVIFTTSKEIDEQLNDYFTTKETLTLEGKSYLELDFRFQQPVLRVDKYSDWMTE